MKYRNEWMTAPIAIGSATIAAEPQRRGRTGVTDTEIEIGNIMPSAGFASALGTVGRVNGAYFTMINGKVNGCHLTLLSRDDGFLPPKTVERSHQLVER